MTMYEKDFWVKYYHYLTQYLRLLELLIGVSSLPGLLDHSLLLQLDELLGLERG